MPSIIVEWDKVTWGLPMPKTATHYELWARYESGEWQLLAEPDARELVLLTVLGNEGYHMRAIDTFTFAHHVTQPGTYSYRVRAVYPTPRGPGDWSATGSIALGDEWTGDVLGGVPGDIADAVAVPMQVECAEALTGAYRAIAEGTELGIAVQCAEVLTGAYEPVAEAVELSMAVEIAEVIT